MRTFKSIPLRAAAAAALVAIAGSAQANLLTNGSFELGSLQNSGFTQEVTGSTNIAGWTVVGDELAWFHSAFGAQLSASEGVKFLDLTHLTAGCTPCGGVQQTIATTPGTEYTLSFDLGSSSLFLTPSAVQTTVQTVLGGVVSSTFTSTATGQNNWETFTTNFIATNATTNIQLVGSFAQGDYAGLDNVSVVVATPVPEPGAMALMLAGLAAVGSVASRRRIQR